MTTGETHQQAAPVCPHCGHEMDTEDMLTHREADLFAIAPNEETVSIKCMQCDLDYWVKGGYTPHYTTAFSEEEL